MSRIQQTNGHAECLHQPGLTRSVRPSARRPFELLPGKTVADVGIDVVYLLSHRMQDHDHGDGNEHENERVLHHALSLVAAQPRTVAVYETRKCRPHGSFLLNSPDRYASLRMSPPVQDVTLARRCA